MLTLLQTPHRAESVKKPKIKLTNNSTPKASNGVDSPSTKDSSKAVKVKAKPAKGGKEKTDSKKKEPAAPKEPELSPEEKRLRKEVRQFGHIAIASIYADYFTEGDTVLATSTSEGPIAPRPRAKGRGDEVHVGISGQARNVP